MSKVIHKIKQTEINKMPPKATTTSKILTTKCIKFGLIVTDENKKTLLICDYCYTIYTNLQQFNQHLNNCNSVKHFFENSECTRLQFWRKLGHPNTGIDLFKKIKSDSKEFLIYNVKNEKEKGIIEQKSDATNDDQLVSTDLIKIEEELLNPRWYNDATEQNQSESNKKVSYTELINAVTPFVQFKENVKTVMPPSKQQNNTSLKVNCKEQMKSKGIILNNESSSTTSMPIVKVVGKEKSKSQLSEKIPTATLRLVEGSVRNMRNIQHTNMSTITNNPMLKRKTISTVNVKSSRPDVEQIAKRRKTSDESLKKSIQPSHVINNPSNTITKFVDNVSKKPSPLPSAVNVVDNINNTSSQLSSVIKVENIINKSTAVKVADNNSKPTQLSSATNLKMFGKTSSHANKSQTNTHQSNKAIVTMVESKQTKHPSTIKISSSKTLPSQIIRTLCTPKAVSVQPTHAIPVVTSAPISPIKKLTLPPQNTKISKPQSSNNPQTVEILNKLQTLGLKVKRTNPIQPTIISCNKKSAANARNEEIIRKLQLKGMEVKLLPKSNTSSPAINIKRTSQLSEPSKKLLTLKSEFA